MRPEKQSIHERAAGRWPGILSALGVETNILNTHKHHPCPWCGGKDRFRFTNHDGGGAFYCGQCGTHTAVDFIMNRRGCDFATAAKEIEAVIGDIKAQPVRKQNSNGTRSMKRFWHNAEAIVKGDFVDRYLSARGIVLDQFPECLRKHPVAEHLTEDGVRSVHPAMLAKLVKPDGAGTNVHRTYLTLAGTKASVDPQRKMMAGGVAEGSAVPLFADVQDVLGIAEGIETAFSAAALFGVPVWSGLNTSIMKGWLPPKGVTHVIVFGDHDDNYAGQAAAFALAAKLRGKQLSVSVEIPETVGDWNDVLVKQKGVTA